MSCVNLACSSRCSYGRRKDNGQLGGKLAMKVEIACLYTKRRSASAKPAFSADC